MESYLYLGLFVSVLVNVCLLVERTHLRRRLKAQAKDLHGRMERMYAKFVEIREAYEREIKQEVMK